METTKTLQKLAKSFQKKGSTLFIVGGFVRNNLLGLPSDDIDITGSLKHDEVLQICHDLKFKCEVVNKSLGTILIRHQEEEYEYTTFRKESYAKDGGHSPSQVEFVDDINVDCSRRDFTVNSIYYDILSDKIIDPCNGQRDIAKKILRTTSDPADTFNDDPLRILRLVRFASAYNFSIARDTFAQAKTYAPRLNKLSKERIRQELEKLVVADLKFDLQNKTFFKCLSKFNLLPYIFNHSATRAKAFSRRDQKNFYICPAKSRLIMFYVLILKNYINEGVANIELQYIANLFLGKEGINESTHNIRTCEKLYRVFNNIHYNASPLIATLNYLALSDDEKKLIERLFDKRSKLIFFDNMNYIKSKNMPLGVHQLDITATQLIDAGINKIYISKILTTLFNLVLESKIPNTNQELLNTAIEINKNFENI